MAKTPMSEQKGPQPRPAPGPVGCLFILAGRIVGLVTGALLLRLVVELLGLYFCWPQDSAQHIFQVVAQEHTELALRLQPHPAGKEMLVQLENALEGVLYLRQQIHLFFLKDLLDTLAYTLTSSLLRLVWLVAILPLLCLCILTGLVDGLVQRDLRRFGTGLESTFIHRYTRRIGSSVATTLLIFWLAQPFCLPATLILLPAATGFGAIIWAVACSFKRWL